MWEILLLTWPVITLFSFIFLSAGLFKASQSFIWTSETPIIDTTIHRPLCESLFLYHRVWTALSSHHCSAHSPLSHRLSVPSGYCEIGNSHLNNHSCDSQVPGSWANNPTLPPHLNEVQVLMLLIDWFQLCCLALLHRWRSELIWDQCVHSADATRFHVKKGTLLLISLSSLKEQWIKKNTNTFYYTFSKVCTMINIIENMTEIGLIWFVFTKGTCFMFPWNMFMDDLL